MQDVFIGEGKLAKKGVYANRDFKKGEVVIQYHLTPLSEEDYQALPAGFKRFTHRHHGVRMMYGEPERYVNNSKTPNTFQDHVKKCDIALKDIKKGEMITTDSSKDNIH